MNRAQICILGTFHFVEASHLMPINNEQRQKEFKSLINKILQFKPNKLCVELRPNQELKYNEIYKKYLSDSSIDLKKELVDYQLQGASYIIINPLDERIKFAFDMAHVADINSINGIDYYDGWIQQEVFDEAEKNNKEQYEMLTNSYNIFAKKVMGMLKPENNIEDMYKYLNMKETNELQHSTGFMPFNDVGDGDDAIGIKFVSDWYNRNLHIYANLKRIAKPDDRILVLYGAGHRKLLSDFISESPDLEYVDSIKYL